ncbi:serine protease [Amycolatopsis vancoresmycina DSM 44592]|uniref:Serine protease n=1 Tax=Amycolatopsis vancoresmycina DSM 44592 TaxID=1292037 RepID=R1ICF8_9PSEU|nr:serine protease [Amycolatopsis vancoresmycina DSM 44592]
MLAATGVVWLAVAGVSGPAQAAADPRLLAAMQRDLHLDSAQATELLAVEAAAGRTERRLRAEFGTRFGGAWLSSSTLVVAVTDPALADAVKAAGAEPKLVRRSESELGKVKSTLDKAARPAARAVSGWYVDAVTNAVVVRAHPDAVAVAAAFVGASGADPRAVRVEVSAGTPRTLDRVPLGIYGGDLLRVPLGRCSLGFSVLSYVQHFTGWTTAGHCGRAGDAATPGFDVGATGTFRGSVFPGNDHAWVSHDNYDFDFGPFAMPQVNDYQGDGVRVEGLQEAPVGASICRSGITSGWRCGTIQAKNETVNYAEGTVTGLTRTSACAEPGDSGGPYLSGGQAQGTTSGGSGDCTFGGTTYFQPINPVLRAYQLKLFSVNGALDPL